jgi:hypothetical protein
MSDIGHSFNQGMNIADFKNYKISTVSDHEKSCVHTDAVRVIESQKQVLTQQTTAHKTGMALKEHTRKYPA